MISDQLQGLQKDYLTSINNGNWKRTWTVTNLPTNRILSLKWVKQYSETIFPYLHRLTPCTKHSYNSYGLRNFYISPSLLQTCVKSCILPHLLMCCFNYTILLPIFPNLLKNSFCNPPLFYTRWLGFVNCFWLVFFPMCISTQLADH